MTPAPQDASPAVAPGAADASSRPGRASGAVLPPAHPAGALTDRYGRTVRDLRLSVTDRCNLRCTYCMPAQGLTWLPGPELLTTAEVVRLARIAVERLGVERIRLTGGEPLMRRDLEEIVRALAALRTRDGRAPDLGMTTNGLGLDRRAAALRAAGLRRVNVSIDTLDPAGYAATTRRDRLSDVLRGAVGAQEAGLWPLKVNAVAQPGDVETQAPRLLAECLRRGWQLRFIEHMPLGPPRSWDPAEVVDADQVLAALEAAGFRLTRLGRADRRPATLWAVAPSGPGAPGERLPGGTVGVVASVTSPFCSDCDRTRLTADGRLMTCLFASQETDLRGPMRAGASDLELAGIWRQATWGKPLAHGSDAPAQLPDGFARPARTMSAIGG